MMGRTIECDLRGASEMAFEPHGSRIDLPHQLLAAGRTTGARRV